MQPTSPRFRQNVQESLADSGLQSALARTRNRFIDSRAKAAAALPEFERLRETGRDIKNHTIAHLDFYLETFERNVIANGGQVHWAATAEDARRIVLDICRAAGAKTVTKGKSMISEEMGINDHLSAHGITPVETDLGEYIIQLKHEPPSHIIAPAFHLNREDWEQRFRDSHTHLDPDRRFAERRDILAEARSVLRERFMAADVGITGATGFLGLHLCKLLRERGAQVTSLVRASSNTSHVLWAILSSAVGMNVFRIAVMSIGTY